MGDAFTNDLAVISIAFLDYPVITLLAEEGPRTVSRQRTGQSGAQDDVHTFADEIAKGDPLVMDPAQDLTVLLRTTEQNIIGFATTISSPMEGIEILGLLEAGVVADPELNQITLEVLGSWLRTVRLGAGSAAVVPGDSVKLHTSVPQEWEKGTANNGTLVVSGGSAGEDIGLILGHVGVFS